MDHRELARLGGLARAKSMTPEERSEIARKAVAARWKQKPDKSLALAVELMASIKKNNKAGWTTHYQRLAGIVEWLENT